MAKLKLVCHQRPVLLILDILVRRGRLGREFPEFPGEVAVRFGIHVLPSIMIHMLNLLPFLFPQLFQRLRINYAMDHEFMQRVADRFGDFLVVDLIMM